LLGASQATDARAAQARALIAMAKAPELLVFEPPEKHRSGSIGAADIRVRREVLYVV
jgi:hypothetical protein